MLEFTAIPVKHADYLTQGAGDVNAGGAIALSSAIDTSAKLGSWWLRSGVPAHTMIGSQLYAWGQSVIWGGKDIYIDPRMGEEFSQKTGAPLTVLPGIGHYPHLQDPARTVEEVRAEFK